MLPSSVYSRQIAQCALDAYEIKVKSGLMVEKDGKGCEGTADILAFHTGNITGLPDTEQRAIAESVRALLAITHDRGNIYMRHKRSAMLGQVDDVDDPDLSVYRVKEKLSGDIARMTQPVIRRLRSLLEIGHDGQDADWHRQVTDNFCRPHIARVMHLYDIPYVSRIERHAYPGEAWSRKKLARKFQGPNTGALLLEHCPDASEIDLAARIRAEEEDAPGESYDEYLKPGKEALERVIDAYLFYRDHGTSIVIDNLTLREDEPEPDFYDRQLRERLLMHFLSILDHPKHKGKSVRILCNANDEDLMACLGFCGMNPRECLEDYFDKGSHAVVFEYRTSDLAQAIRSRR